MPIGTTGVNFGGGYYGIYIPNDNLGQFWVYYNNILTQITSSPNSVSFSENGFCSYNGLLYQYGGYGGSGVDTNALYSYNPLTNTWTLLAPSPLNTGSGGVNNMGFIGMNGNLYTISGYQSSGGFSTATALNNIYVYNIATNTWAAKNNMPDSIPGSFCINNNIIYRVGGLDGSASNIFYSYYPETDIWIQLANHPNSNGIEDLQIIPYGNKIWCAGGADGNTGQPVTACFVYDIASNSWSSFTSLPVATDSYDAGLYKNKLYIMGGSVPSSNTTNIYSYSFENNTWTKESGTLVNILNGGYVGVVAELPIGLGKF